MMAKRHVTLGEIEKVIAGWDSRYSDKKGNPNLIKRMEGWRFKVVVSKETVGTQHPFVITVAKDPE